MLKGVYADKHFKMSYIIMNMFENRPQHFEGNMYTLKMLGYNGGLKRSNTELGRELKCDKIASLPEANS
jgi:hypothetical protein